jgi:hypothetical protein
LRDLSESEGIARESGRGADNWQSDEKPTT